MRRKQDGREEHSIMNHHKLPREKSDRFSTSIDDSYCPSCLAAIAPGLLKYEGITKVAVLHAGRQIVVEYDPDRISHQELKEALESAIAENFEAEGGLSQQ
ncbi:MAG: heavy-metal-associated domain-containing protein [Candidatus Thorarchaeota archaeon]